MANTSGNFSQSEIDNFSRKKAKTKAFDLNGPHDDESEQAVLGALLTEELAWDRVADLIQGEDFFWPAHGAVYTAIAQLKEQSQPVDPITVKDKLIGSTDLAAAGGLDFLDGLTSLSRGSQNVREYAIIIRAHSTRRKLISTARSVIDKATSDYENEVEIIVDQAEQAFFAVSDGQRKTDKGFLDVNTMLVEVIDKLQDRAESGNDSILTGTSTGFLDLDEKTTGFNAGDLIILAARPAMGKSSLAMNIAESIAIKDALPVAVFSLEMPASQLITRMISSIGRVDQQKIRTSQLSQDDWGRISDASETLGRAKIFIDETPSLTPLDVRARCRRLTRQHGKLGAIVIDYLQLMQPSIRTDNRANDVSEMSKSLKALAKELECPVIALAQLNRSLEQRPNKRPVMSDLRESGGLEQDADIILFIYRDEIYNPDSEDAGTAEIIIGKQRNGPIGTVRLAFNGACTKFENLAPGYKPASSSPPPVSKGKSGYSSGNKGSGESRHYAPGF